MIFGKVLKVKQYNLEFGSKDRFVNVFGCFKYLPNGNIYVVYADTDTRYNIVYYGSAHLKENNVLSMECRDVVEAEIIKEFIFKVTQKQPLDNFQIFSLEAVDTIEIIASSKLEVKPEILTTLVDIVIPKPEVKEEVIEEKIVVKKEKSNKTILILLMVILILGIVGFFVFGNLNKNNINKSIICTKTYQDDTLKAKVTETSKYNFNVNDNLEDFDTTMFYQFDKASYQDFIMKGTYHKYMPTKEENGSWDKDDKLYTFEVVTKTGVDTSYNKPTTYEKALAYYRNQGYNCKEEIINE